MIITIDTGNPLTAEDKAALRALCGEPTVVAEMKPERLFQPGSDEDGFGGDAPEPEPKPEPEPEPEAKPAPKKRGRPRKVAEPEPEPKPEPKPEPEPEAEAKPDEDEKPTREEVASLALRLIDANRRDEVAAVLNSLGVAKIRYLDEDQIPEAYRLIKELSE